MTDRLSGIMDAVRMRLDEELRQQLAALTAEHERGLEEALREAAQTAERQAQEAEARWAALLTEARSEAQQMVESAVAAARADFQSERTAAQAASSGLTGRLVAELAGATRLTDVLGRLADAVSTGNRGALLVTRRGILVRWPEQGTQDIPEPWTGAAAAALQTLAPRSHGGSRAVPLLLDGAAVAVLVAPEEAGGPGSLDALALAGTARLATLTATRLVQADRWMGGHGPLVRGEPAQPQAGASNR